MGVANSICHTSLHVSSSCMKNSNSPLSTAELLAISFFGATGGALVGSLVFSAVLSLDEFAVVLWIVLPSLATGCAAGCVAAFRFRWRPTAVITAAMGCASAVGIAIVLMLIDRFSKMG